MDDSPDGAVAGTVASDGAAILVATARLAHRYGHANWRLFLPWAQGQ
jgi:hypothetical protein